MIGTIEKVVKGLSRSIERDYTKELLISTSEKEREQIKMVLERARK